MLGGVLLCNGFRWSSDSLVLAGENDVFNTVGVAAATFCPTTVEADVVAIIRPDGGSRDRGDDGCPDHYTSGWRKPWWR